MSVLGLLISLILLAGISIFPGVFALRNLSEFKRDEKLIAVIFLSLGFWIILPNFLSVLGLPLDLSFFSLLVLQVLVFVWLNRMRFAKSIFKLSYISTFDGLLIGSVLIYFLAFLFMRIPPGADSTMHGYITTLVLHYNGVPASYEPILPYDNFGSYSAGHQYLTAYLTGFNESNLLSAFKLGTTLPYSLVILALYFLLRQFYTQRVAVIGAVVPFMLTGVIQGSIGWGGNPTVLAFAFCVFVYGILYRSLKDKNRHVLLLTSIPLAAIPLIHAIPAVGFLYTAFFGFIVFLIYHQGQIKWTFTKVLYLMIVTLGLLAPFLINLEIEQSEELIGLIKEWQQEMTHHRYGASFFDNIGVTFDRINNRISDKASVLGVFSTVFLLVKKRWGALRIALALFALLFILFINSNYWFLPFSEILYPERIAFFILICVSVLWSEFLKTSFEKPYYLAKKIPFHYLIVVFFLVVGIIQFDNKYLHSIYANPISYNQEIQEGFSWVKENTNSNDLIQVSYWDAGMWIPAFAKRSIVGGHMHFIHQVAKCQEKLLERSADRYLFVTKKDILESNPIVEMGISGRVVFQNKEVKIIAL